MDLKPERALRRDAPLARHLETRGLCARIVVARLDGAPLTDEDVREADAALVAFEQADRRAWKAFAAAQSASHGVGRAKKTRGSNTGTPRSRKVRST